MNHQNKTFEESMQRLEQIVRAMERGDVPLEESLKLFQEGTQLIQSCAKLLDEAERLKKEELEREKQRRRDERERQKREEQLAREKALREEQERQEQERLARIAEEERQRKEAQEQEERERREQYERDMAAIAVYSKLLQDWSDSLPNRLKLREQEIARQRRAAEIREQERLKRLQARKGASNN